MAHPTFGPASCVWFANRFYCHQGAGWSAQDTDLFFVPLLRDCLGVIARSYRDEADRYTHALADPSDREARRALARAVIAAHVVEEHSLTLSRTSAQTARLLKRRLASRWPPVPLVDPNWPPDFPASRKLS
jgi:hypothetical protein